MTGPGEETTLKVIGAGFGRTGTMSLKVALEELGFDPCYHMTEVFENPEHVELWEAAARRKPVDWEQIFHGYQATVDWPGAAFYKELMEQNSHAKVILTVRDPERWYESVRRTIYNIRKIATSPLFSFLALFVPQVRRMKRAALMAADLAWEGVFDGRFEDRRYAIEVFERWNEEVREQVPAEKLLVYEVKDGWAPLCAFLDVEPPDKPFPHLNDTASFRKMIRRRLAFSIAALAGGSGLSILALLYLRSARRNR